MSLASEILADSPNGFWKLDETSGTTATDSSGNSRDGTYASSGMVGTETGPCNIGGVAPLFSAGATTYIEVPSSSAWTLTTALTIEAMVRLDGSATEGCIVSHDVRDNPPFSETADAYNLYPVLVGGMSGLQFEANNDSPFAQGYIACDARGKWMHVAMTYDSTRSPRAKLFIQGSEVGTGANVPTFDGGTRPLLIGRRGIAGSFFHVGALSHVAIYGSTLSDARIAAHAAAVSCPRLCGPFPLRLFPRNDDLDGPRLPQFFDSASRSTRLGGTTYE